MRMRVFLKSIHGRAWRSILTGWSPPTIKDASGKVITKSEIDWTNNETEIAGYNSKALNAIFTAVDENQFRLISNCPSAKEAWEILQVAYEENSRVRQMKLRILDMRFENLRMDEEETILSSYAKLCDIANEAHELEKPYSNKELVLKVLRSLPKTYEDKIVAIETSRDIITLKLEELIASLEVFEMRTA